MILERATPASQGVFAGSIINILDRFKKHAVNFHSIMILRHGKVIAEGFRAPYRPEYNHMLFSLSKSFTGTAIGFAVSEGLLKVEDKVIAFFPELLPCAPCEYMQEMTIHNLLTMSTGHSAEPYTAVFTENGKWEEAFLRSYIDLKPGTRFVYNTPATFMLSAIIQRVSGQKLIDYLNPRLFEPLGITNMTWEENPDCVNYGGFGLSLKTEDIAKFGLFLQNRGVACRGGKQLLSPEWIDTASSKQIENYGERDWGSGYCYQLWRCAPVGVYRADGAFGQLCIVDNKNDIVVAVTAGTADMRAELTDIFDSLYEALSDTPIVGSDEAEKQEELLKRLSSLEIPTPIGNNRHSKRLVQNRSYSVSPVNNNFPIYYSFAGSKLNIESFSLSFSDKPCMTLTIDNNEYKLPLGYEKYLEGATSFGRTACAYAFDGEMLFIKMIFVETPFAFDVSFDFCDNGAVLSVKNPIVGEMNMTAFCLLR